LPSACRTVVFLLIGFAVGTSYNHAVESRRASPVPSVDLKVGYSAGLAAIRYHKRCVSFVPCRGHTRA
jgi:hypothetical protein